MNKIIFFVSQSNNSNEQNKTIFLFQNTGSYHFIVFKELTKDILTNMMEYISLPAVLQRIMQDPTYSSGKFSDIKVLNRFIIVVA